MRALTAGVAAIGVLAIIGYLLDLPDLLDVYWFAQVSLPTAISFVALGVVGLWLGWRDEPWNAARFIKGEDDRIAFAGTLVLGASILRAAASGQTKTAAEAAVP